MTSLIPLAIVAATPLLLAVLGEVILERSGIINIGLEGMMLSAALTAVVFAQFSGSALVGILGGVAGALVAGLLFGILTIGLQSDQIVTGAAVNFVALGLTGVFYRDISAADAFARNVPSVGSWHVPLLSRIPGLGPLLFRYDPVVVFAWVIAPAAVSLLLWRTRTGLRLRACGEYPAAVLAAGHSVANHQWLALAIEIVLAGTAGAYLSLALSPGFAENMVAGRGFIALAVVVFGRWSGRGSVAGVALFGVTAAAQYVLQASLPGFPFHLLLALPYVVTLVVLAAYARAGRPPEYLGRSATQTEDV